MSEPPTVGHLAVMFRDADEFGALHIIVSDGNVDDGNLDYCAQHHELTERDKLLLDALRSVTEAEREDAWYMANCR